MNLHTAFLMPLFGDFSHVSFRESIDHEKCYNGQYDGNRKRQDRCNAILYKETGKDVAYQTNTCHCNGIWKLGGDMVYMVAFRSC